jgi:hypothetical protein
MTQAILSPSVGSAERGISLNGRMSAESRMRYSRLIGVLFPLGFLAYGVGFGLVTSVTGGSNFLATIPAHQTTLVVGAFLMLLNTFVDVGKGVLFFPILERHDKRTALVYLATIIVEVVFLAIGVLALLLLGPLAQQSVDAGAANVGWAHALGSLALQTNTVAYQIGELSLGVGAIFLCLLLFRSRLIPRFLAGWGVVGYVILAAGSIAEIFAIHISVVLSIPGGLFELGLGFWLLIKGFRPEAYSSQPTVE